MIVFVYLELFSRKDEALLVGRDSLHHLDFEFDLFDAVKRVHVDCYRLAGEGFDENLHGGLVDGHRIRGPDGGR